MPTSDFDAARDKIIMGAKREDIITEKDKRLTAYHEAGHALVAWLTPNADPVHKVTIIPRGRALGVTQFLPEEDRVGINESEVIADLTVALGGRAAERLVFNDPTAGAAGDLALAVNWGYRNPRGAIMPGSGRAVQRAYSEAELQSFGAAGPELEGTLALFGETTFDVFLNGRAYWRNVPERVWTYTLGGYQVVKKWLSYREEGVLGRALTADEAR